MSTWSRLAEVLEAYGISAQEVAQILYWRYSGTMWQTADPAERERLHTLAASLLTVVRN